jgi:putative hydrolase of the HAD superfamily
MKISAISIDFWNTLYVHQGTSEYRAHVRKTHLVEYCKSLNITAAEHAATTFFDVVDKFIKHRWSEDHCPLMDDIISHAALHYNDIYDKDVIRQIFDYISNLYQDQLKPELYEGASDFLEWASKTWPIYLISDTFTLRSTVLDSILRKDGLIDLFQDRLYSDVLGVQKPDVTAVEMILKREGIAPQELVHIGDLNDRDYELAQRAGCYSILLDNNKSNKEVEEQGGRDKLIAKSRSFEGVKEVLEEIYFAMRYPET